MSAPRKTSRALPNVPGAAMVQALGDAVFGKGNAVVEATYPVTFQGRPVTVNLSVEEVVRYLTREGWEESGRNALVFEFSRDGNFVSVPNMDNRPNYRIGLTDCIANIVRYQDGVHALDVVDAILAARHGAAPPGDGDATTAAILALFAVAPDTGIAEDEVVRHLLALDLTSDVDDVSDRLLAMVTATTLAIVHRGKPDTRKRGPLHYARGPAFPAATMGDRR